MRRVLVTGATGFLGRHVIHALVQKGITPVAIGRDAERCAALTAQGIKTIRHNLEHPFPEGLDIGTVDAVVHCAALSAASGPRRAFERANVDATRHIADLARRLCVTRFVHISSPTVYFNMGDALLVREDTPLPAPVNAYAQTKRLSEEIVQAMPEIGPVILRPRGIYGPGDTSLLPKLLRAAQRPLPLFREGRAAIDLTYVDDVVSAIWAALCAPSDQNGEIFNISSGDVKPIRYIVDQTCKAHQITARWRKMPLAPALAFGRVLDLAAAHIPNLPPPNLSRYAIGLFAYAQSLDISKAQAHLGWRPTVSFDEGLARTCAQDPQT